MLKRIAKGKHPIGGKGYLGTTLIAVRAEHQQEVNSMIDKYLAAPKKKPKLVDAQARPSLAQKWLAAQTETKSDEGSTPGAAKLQAMRDRIRAKNHSTTASSS